MVHRITPLFLDSGKAIKKRRSVRQALWIRLGYDPDRGLGPIPGPETLLPRARGDTVDGRSPDLRIILKIAFPDRSSGCTNAWLHL